MKTIIIRQVIDDDIEEIKDVVKAAFYRPGKNEYFNKWEFVQRVRNENIRYRSWYWSNIILLQ